MEIISTSLRLTKTFALAGTAILACSAAANAAEIILQKVPPLTVEQAPSYPENLARYQFGAQVEATPQSNPASSLKLSSKSEDDNAAEAALLCGDPTVGYGLANGTSTLLISLAKVENVDSISFLNHGAKGEVAIATSNAKVPADSPQWHDVAKQELNDTIKAKIGPSEAKYVRLTFNVTEPGRINGLGVYSTPTVAAFTMPRNRKVDTEKSESLALISNNLTDLHAKARALYVSSGDDVKRANDMIDDQPATAYPFAQTDAGPTAVIDLGKVTKLRRISALYSPRQGTLDFYVLEFLPSSWQSGAAKTLKLDDAALASLQPVGSVSDAGSGRAAIDFPETPGRYIMVRWTPAQQDAPFALSEVAAFGGAKSEKLVAANTSAGGNRETMSSDYKTVAEGKDFGDGKDIPSEGPAEPAEGPGGELPPPPPFTFVPEVLPTSP